MDETWKTCSESFMYEVSTEGSFRNKASQRLLKRRWREEGSGRYTIDIKESYGKRTLTLHTIIWESFNRRLRKGEYVLFRDGDSKNCRLSNLYVGPHPQTKLKRPQIIAIKKELIRTERGHGVVTRLTKQYGVSDWLIKDIDEKYPDSIVEEEQDAGPAETIPPEEGRADVSASAEETPGERRDTIAGVEVDATAAAYFAT